MKYYEAIYAWIAVSLGVAGSSYCSGEALSAILDHCWWVGAGIFGAWIWMHFRKAK
jgi:hypothetical protein